MQIFVCVLNTLLRIVGLLIIYLLLDASPSCKFRMYIRIRIHIRSHILLSFLFAPLHFEFDLSRVGVQCSVNIINNAEAFGKRDY